MADKRTKLFLFCYYFVFFAAGVGFICLHAYLIPTNHASLGGKDHLDFVEGAIYTLQGVSCAVGIIFMTVGPWSSDAGILRTLLTAFTACVAFLVFAEFTLAIMVWSYQEPLKELVANTLEENLKEAYGRKDLIEKWEFAHQTYECCGTHGPESWYGLYGSNATKNIPDSCCIRAKLNGTIEGCGKSAKVGTVYIKGCLGILTDTDGWTFFMLFCSSVSKTGLFIVFGMILTLNLCDFGGKAEYIQLK